jgi:uncharacterized membrane protein YeaQ/YmgE (transglycosylase-associated protein family)
MEIVAVVLAGIVLGLIGRCLAPGGRDDLGLVVTALCGLVGAIAGWYAAAGLGIASPSMFRWVVSIMVAAILVAAMAILTSRSLAGRL